MLNFVPSPVWDPLQQSCRAAAFWSVSLSESQVVRSFHLEGVLLGLLQAPVLGADEDSAPGKQFTLTLRQQINQETEKPLNPHSFNAH